MQFIISLFRFCNLLDVLHLSLRPSDVLFHFECFEQSVTVMSANTFLSSLNQRLENNLNLHPDDDSNVGSIDPSINLFLLCGFSRSPDAAVTSHSPEGGGTAVSPVVQLWTGSEGVAEFSGSLIDSVHPSQTDPEITVRYASSSSCTAHCS